MLANKHVEVLDFAVVTQPEISDRCPLMLKV
jgi:hypothetical protein